MWKDSKKFKESEKVRRSMMKLKMTHMPLTRASDVTENLKRPYGANFI